MESWTGVELRHLAALAAIHEERSFRGAADRLGYVQSAVSQQIAQLELLVGARLVDRARGHAPPVRLTEAGLLLLDHASRILGQLDAAEADLRALAADGAQSLRVGVDQSVATRLLPAVLTKLSAKHPVLSVALEEASSDRAHIERVERGELDAAFGELPLGAESLEVAELLVDPCVLLVPRDSPLAAPDATVELADLVATPLVTLLGWPMMELIEAHLRSAGHEPRYAMSANTSTTAQALAGAGVGPAILPRLAVNPDDPRVALVDLSELLPSRTVALYWHEGRRNVPSLAAFHAATVAAARELRRASARRAGAPAPTTGPASGAAGGEGRAVGDGGRRRPGTRRTSVPTSASAAVLSV